MQIRIPKLNISKYPPSSKGIPKGVPKGDPKRGSQRGMPKGVPKGDSERGAHKAIPKGDPTILTTAERLYAVRCRLQAVDLQACRPLAHIQRLPLRPKDPLELTVKVAPKTLGATFAEALMGVPEPLICK